MTALLHALVPIIVIVVVALIIWYAAERFSPDPFITRIVQIVLFAVVLIAILLKLVPLLGLG
jgi:hypothetical protein